MHKVETNMTQLISTKLRRASLYSCNTNMHLLVIYNYLSEKHWLKKQMLKSATSPFMAEE